MSRFHEPDGSRAEYAVWHEPQLSAYVCGGMRRRFGECFLYPSCASASPTIPQSKRPVNPQRYLFSMRSLLAAFAVGWTATYPSRAEYAVWHEPQLSAYVCGGMRRRFGECFLYPSCASASPTIPQSKRPVNPQRYLFSMRSLLAAFAVGWTATYPERREEYVNAAFSRHLRERGGRDAGLPFRGVASLCTAALTRHSVPTAPRAA